MESVASNGLQEKEGDKVIDGTDKNGPLYAKTATSFEDEWLDLRPRANHRGEGTTRRGMMPLEMPHPLMPPSDEEEPRCWGSLITGHQQCVPGFIPGTPPRAPRQISRIFLSAPHFVLQGRRT